MPSHTDIKDYYVFRWRSCLSISVDYFTTLLRDPSLESSFSEDFAVRVGERSREMQRLDFRVSFLLIPFIFLLAAFNSEFVQKITIFGISLSKDNATLGVLLLISAILMIFSSVASIVSSYYNLVLKAYVAVHHDERVVNFYIQQFQFNIGSIFDGFRNENFEIKHNLFTLTIVVFWSVSIICAAILIKLLILFIFIGAIISTLNVPGIPNFINFPIIAVASCAIVFEATSMLLQCPLPFTDFSNKKKLEELEKTEPILADEIRNNIARRGLDQDRRNSIALQVIVLIGFILGPTWFVLGKDLFSRYEIVADILLALAIMLMVFSPLVDKAEKKILAKAFEMTDKELSLKRYISSKKLIAFVRLSLAAIIGFVVFLGHH